MKVTLLNKKVYTLDDLCVINKIIAVVFATLSVICVIPLIAIAFLIVLLMTIIEELR